MKLVKELQCASKDRGRCLGLAVNRKDAVRACLRLPGKGWRLCAKEEIDSGKCCKTGCGLDDANVWIRGAPTYDGCTKPTDPPPEVTVALPESKNVSTAPVNPPGATSRRIAVRCCRSVGTCLQCRSKNEDGKCIAGTGSNVGMTRRDAQQACRDIGDGWNLCTKEQLDTGKCCGTGCNYDNHYTWIQSGGATSRLTNDPLKPKPGSGKTITLHRVKLGTSKEGSEVKSLSDLPRDPDEDE